MKCNQQRQLVFWRDTTYDEENCPHRHSMHDSVLYMASAWLPSLYEDIQKIAYVERRSVSELLSDLMVQYRDHQKSAISEYEKVKKMK